MGLPANEGVLLHRLSAENGIKCTCFGFLVILPKFKLIAMLSWTKSTYNHSRQAQALNSMTNGSR